MVFSRIGIPELLVILVIALIIFGAKRLPEIGKLLGRGIGEFKNAATELKSSIDLDAKDVDTKKGGEKTK